MALLSVGGQQVVVLCADCFSFYSPQTVSERVINGNLG